MRSLYRGSFVGGAMTGHCCSSGCASYVDGMWAEAHWARRRCACGRDAAHRTAGARPALTHRRTVHNERPLDCRGEVDRLLSLPVTLPWRRSTGSNEASNSVAAMSDDDSGNMRGGLTGDADDSTALSDAQEALEDARRRIAEVPAQVVVVNHLMGLYELAAIHLSSVPPKLDEASLAIDALAALVEKLGERLGEETATMRDALSNIQMVYVQMKSRG